MVICVTNRTLCKEDFLKRMTSICKAGPKFIILREKDLDRKDYTQLAAQCLAICKTYGVQLVLHTHIQAALELGITAIHLPLPILKQESKQLDAFTMIGTSIHDVKEVALAQQLGATYLIAGHIFQTDCKADLNPRGISFLKKVQSASHIPVYPIGGIHKDTAQEIVNAGATDFCMMSELMTCENVEQNIKMYHQITPKTDLCTIPGVGLNMKQHMINLGYHWVEDLKQANPEEMYQQDCILHGTELDRCVLYVYRLAVYFATTPSPEQEKLTWWYWKEHSPNI